MTFSVMIVDDDADVRKSISMVLREEGIEVTAAEHGLAALERLRAGLRPHLILLDIMMPIMDGRAFRAEQLQDAELAVIPIVVFTAFGLAQETARELGAGGFLEKPVRLNDLLDTVNRFRPADGHTEARSP